MEYNPIGYLHGTSIIGGTTAWLGLANVAIAFWGKKHATNRIADLAAADNPLWFGSVAQTHQVRWGRGLKGSRFGVAQLRDDLNRYRYRIIT